MSSLPQPEIAARGSLDANQVAVEAEAAVRALPVARDREFESLYSCLIVDEPAVHLLPLHFLPSGASQKVGAPALKDLGVAAKLEYARNRWLDEVVDSRDPSPVPLTAHRLNDAVLDLIRDRYGRVLGPTAAASFYGRLSDLHARHGMSMALDGRRRGCLEPSLGFEEYVAHARARHGPMRASLDALLLLADAPEGVIRKARASWHDWELGVQFYDDALDVEEDFRDRNPSWAVSRTLDIFRGKSGTKDRSMLPRPDAFYELALSAGVVCQALAYAEDFFEASARLADQTFPTWAALQRQCLGHTRGLREDYQAMIAGSEKA